jgi:hypothetical protein
VALAVTAFFCFCVAIALLPGLHTKPMAVASPRCTCRQPAALPWRRKDKTVSSQTSTLIDINELSKRLSIPKGTIYNWAYLPRISYVKAGRSLRFDSDDAIRSLPHYSESEEARLRDNECRTIRGVWSYAGNL